MDFYFSPPVKYDVVAKCNALRDRDLAEVLVRLHPLAARDLALDTAAVLNGTATEVLRKIAKSPYVVWYEKLRREIQRDIDYARLDIKNAMSTIRDNAFLWSKASASLADVCDVLEMNALVIPTLRAVAYSVFRRGEVMALAALAKEGKAPAMFVAGPVGKEYTSMPSALREISAFCIRAAEFELLAIGKEMDRDSCVLAQKAFADAFPDTGSVEKISSRALDSNDVIVSRKIKNTLKAHGVESTGGIGKRSTKRFHDAILLEVFYGLAVYGFSTLPDRWTTRNAFVASGCDTVEWTRAKSFLRGVGMSDKEIKAMYAEYRGEPKGRHFHFLPCGFLAYVYERRIGEPGMWDKLDWAKALGGVR